jgi:ABC-type antimicrobial peptide transport system permease subunit
MTGNALLVGWYWLRANLRRHSSNFLTIVVLVGVLGGLSIGTVAAAQRTQSSYNAFLASTNPSELTLTIGASNISAELRKLPLVRTVATSSYSINAFPAGRNGAPAVPAALQDGDVVLKGSLGKEFFSEDKTAVVAGRMANPHREDEFVAEPKAAKAMGWHLGETIPMYLYTDAQSNEKGFLTNRVKPSVTITMHLVGLVIRNTQVLVDAIDQRPYLIIFTPALTRQVVNNKYQFNDYSLQVEGGVRGVSAVQREIVAALPPGTPYDFRVTSVVAADVNRSIEPESIALGVFGLIAGLAALIIAVGLISRTIRRESVDLDVLRALGAHSGMIASAGLLGLGGAIILGAVLAVAVALGLSSFSPIGPVRSIYPDRGVAFDWPVLGVGFVGLIVLLGAVAMFTARRHSRRSSSHRANSVPVSSRLGRFASDIGLPLTAVVGLHFAIEPGRDRDTAPVRSAFAGAVLAVAIVVTTLTFGSSLSTLVSQPRLYGWNWNYALIGNGDGVPPGAAKLLNSDPYVEAWSGDNFGNAQIDGVTVPVILTTYRATVSAPILSGHKVNGPGQIVLGAATLQQLHKSVGQDVVVQYGIPKDKPVYVPPTTERIVGTATLPAIGATLTLHADMGVGAMIPLDIEPPAFKKSLRSSDEADNGYSVDLVRLKPGAPKALARASLLKIARYGTKLLQAPPGGGGSDDALLNVQYPAEIENYRSIGAIPDVLALALAVGAVVSLELSLVASVNYRRRDLALLRTLGFKRRQLLATVAWQASFAGAVGVIVGVPIGIIAGRWLWTLFARSVYVVPEPTVPAFSIAIVALCTMVLANVVAALPGRSAARTSTAQVLRGE